MGEQYTIKELVLMLPIGVECMVDTLIRMGFLNREKKYFKMHALVTEFMQLFATFDDWNDTVHSALAKGEDRLETSSVA